MEFVMIVEPDEVGRKRLEAVFQTEKPSFSYQITGRPEEALDILEHQKTDVLVCETSLSVLSGREFFTMAKMISPDTVRVAMTSAEHVKDILSFLNECDIYKLIMKPCASFADFIEPVNAALEYHRLKKQAESDLEQAAEVVMTMLKQHLTIGQMDSVGEYMMEHYLRDLLGYYLETMIHENGNYLMGYNRLKNEFHHEDAGQSFHMIKKEDCEIPPEIFRKILFLLMILTKACRQILGKYAVSVTMETASEKFFVVRFSCDYSQNLDKNGQIIYTGENQECHKDIMDLTEKITDSIVYRTVSLEKENRYILNCAIERRNHRVDS